MRFIFHPHDEKPKAWLPPILCDHDMRVLVPGKLVETDHPPHKPGTKLMVFKPGVSFNVDETDHKNGGYWLAAFLRQHHDFQTLNRGSHPAAHTMTRAGQNN
jgi:hypothetical protein